MALLTLTRKVLFTPATDAPYPRGNDGKCLAFVTNDNGDGTANLVVFDGADVMRQKISIPFIAAGTLPPAGGQYYEFIPEA